jgi:molecular chaperone DnaK
VDQFAGYVGRGAPLLIDVTPLSLSVETVGGFCEKLIERNSPVPTGKKRLFVTAQAKQTSVRVRVSQGESVRFAENTLLGELELHDLREAARGEVTVAVTFILDTDGLLNISATDEATGKATMAHLNLLGLPDPDIIDELAERHHTHPHVL